MLHQDKREVYSDKGWWVVRDDGVYGKRLALAGPKATSHTYKEVEVILPSKEERDKRAMEIMEERYPSVLLAYIDKPEEVRAALKEAREQATEELSLRYDNND